MTTHRNFGIPPHVEPGFTARPSAVRVPHSLIVLALALAIVSMGVGLTRYAMAPAPALITARAVP